MTPKRIATMQWIFDVHHLGLDPDRAAGEPPSNRMRDLLARDWLLGPDGRLTQMGLRALHKATQ